MATALAPSNRTDSRPVKFLPVMVISVPGKPLVGVITVMTGQSGQPVVESSFLQPMLKEISKTAATTAQKRSCFFMVL